MVRPLRQVVADSGGSASSAGRLARDPARPVRPPERGPEIAAVGRRPSIERLYPTREGSLMGNDPATMRWYPLALSCSASV